MTRPDKPQTAVLLQADDLRIVRAPDGRRTREGWEPDTSMLYLEKRAQDREGTPYWTDANLHLSRLMRGVVHGLPGSGFFSAAESLTALFPPKHDGAVVRLNLGQFQVGAQAFETRRDPLEYGDLRVRVQHSDPIFGAVTNVTMDEEDIRQALLSLRTYLHYLARQRAGEENA